MGGSQLGPHAPASLCPRESVGEIACASHRNQGLGETEFSGFVVSVGAPLTGAEVCCPAPLIPPPIGHETAEAGVIPPVPIGVETAAAGVAPSLPAGVEIADAGVIPAVLAGVEMAEAGVIAPAPTGVPRAEAGVIPGMGAFVARGPVMLVSPGKGLPVAVGPVMVTPGMFVFPTAPFATPPGVERFAELVGVPTAAEPLAAEFAYAFGDAGVEYWAPQSPCAAAPFVELVFGGET
jgi:hypothetical protein